MILDKYDFQGRKKIGSCDYPFGLMEGLVGDLHAIIDNIYPDDSHFPGLEI